MLDYVRLPNQIEQLVFDWIWVRFCSTTSIRYAGTQFRSQGFFLFPPHPFFKEKALGTRLAGTYTEPPSLHKGCRHWKALLIPRIRDQIKKSGSLGFLLRKETMYPNKEYFSFISIETSHNIDGILPEKEWHGSTFQVCWSFIVSWTVCFRILL